MWSHFTSCSLPFLSERDLCLFFLRLIYVSTYIYIYIYIKCLIFLYNKKLMTQGTSQLYHTTCSIAVSSFNKGIREVVTTNSSMYERLKTL